MDIGMNMFKKEKPKKTENQRFIRKIMHLKMSKTGNYYAVNINKTAELLGWKGGDYVSLEVVANQPGMEDYLIIRKVKF